MVIIDAFTFYNEIEMLKLRLQYLDPVVDYFIVVESTVTFKGESKKLHFSEHEDEFKPWMHKIRRVIVDDNPTGENPWLREHHQRNCIGRGLDGIGDDEAIVMISDVDEIPNVGAIQRREATYSLEMITFNYSLNYIQTFERWFGTVVTHKKNVIDRGAQYFRDRRMRFPCLQGAGWHFTSFGDVDFVSNKLKQFSHCNDEGVEHDNAEKYMTEGLSHNGKFKLTKTPQAILDTVPDIFKYASLKM
jgi:hypothetical protein